MPHNPDTGLQLVDLIIARLTEARLSRVAELRVINQTIAQFETLRSQRVRHVRHSFSTRTYAYVHKKPKNSSTRRHRRIFLVARKFTRILIRSRNRFGSQSRNKFGRRYRTACAWNLTGTTGERVSRRRASFHRRTWIRWYRGSGTIILTTEYHT